MPAGRLRRRRLRGPRPPAPAADPERRGCATAARRWPTPSARPGSRSRPGWSSSTPAGSPTSGRCRCPRRARSAILTGELAELLADPGARRGRGALRLRAADRHGPADRPDAAAARRASRTACTWSGPARARSADGRSYQERLRGRSDLRGGRGVREPRPRGGRPRRRARAAARRARAAATARRTPREAAPARAHRVRPLRRHRVDVDFDDVGRDGLFLLWGPTGAGKTTLLDAVVFALYGTVPGARGEEKRLRSDHADDDARTEVELELTLGGRAAAGDPPSRAAAAQAARRGLDDRAGPAHRAAAGPASGWEPVSTRIDEGSEHLRTRLGLSTREQFCQVVLLPQGDFARFLRAEPEDRGELLRTLFDVDRFARVEDWLADERTAAREELDRHPRAHRHAGVAWWPRPPTSTVPEEFAPELVGRGAGGAGHRLGAPHPGEAAARRRRPTPPPRPRASGAALERGGSLAARAAPGGVPRPPGPGARRADPPRGARRRRSSRCAARAGRRPPCRAGAGRARGGRPRRARGRAGIGTRCDRAPRPGPRSPTGGRPTHRWPGRCATRPPRCARCCRRWSAPPGWTATSRRASGRSATLDRPRAPPPRRRWPAGRPACLAQAGAPWTPRPRPPARLPGLTRRGRPPADGALEARSRAVALETRADRPARGADTRAREAWLDARERWNDLRTQRLDGMAAELAAAA